MHANFRSDVVGQIVSDTPVCNLGKKLAGMRGMP